MSLIQIIPGREVDQPFIGYIPIQVKDQIFLLIGIDHRMKITIIPHLNMNRVNLFVYAFNSRSWRVIERTGATRELILRQHVARDGELYDMYGYGLIHSDWLALKEDLSKHFDGMWLDAMIRQRKEAKKAGAGAVS